MMKFDPIKMQELVKVIDPDSDGGVTLVFTNEQTLKIKITDNGTLSAEFA